MAPKHRQDKEVNAWLQAASAVPGAEVALSVFDAGASAITDFTEWWVGKYAKGEGKLDGDGALYIGFLPLVWSDFAVLKTDFASSGKSLKTACEVLTMATITSDVYRFGCAKDAALASAVVVKENEGSLPPGTFLKTAAAMMMGPPATDALREIASFMQGESKSAKELSDWVTIVGAYGGPVAKASRLYMLFAFAKPTVKATLTAGESYLASLRIRNHVMLRVVLQRQNVRKYRRRTFPRVAGPFGHPSRQRGTYLYRCPWPAASA